MEGTTMIKKEYLQPTMDVVEINMNVQILAGSVTDIDTTGLDDPPTTGGSGDIGGATSPLFDGDAWDILFGK